MAFHLNDPVDPVDDDAYLVSLDVKDYESTLVLFIVVGFALCTLLDVEPLVEVDDGDDLSSKVDDSLDIIRRVRNRSDGLNLDNLLYVHNVHAIQLVSKLKCYQLILTDLIGHS